jgi:pimeloyl-ACP methyl ester carboxylesterase
LVIIKQTFQENSGVLQSEYAIMPGEGVCPIRSLAVTGFDIRQLAEPQLKFVTCAHPGGLHRLAYWQWGDPASQPVVVMAHGLTRNGRDFDVLASEMAKTHCVVAMDFPGRGQSDRFSQPALYDFAQYLADSVSLVARLNVTQLYWVGTSMGGLVGMLYASLPGNPIAKLVLNDIGPEIDDAGRQRIAQYVGEPASWASFDEAHDALKGMMLNFGPHTNEQFKVLSRYYFKQENGQWVYHYDRAISGAVKSSATQPVINLWPMYEAIKARCLVVRGAQSDILAQSTMLQMAERGPKAQWAEFEGVGHAPTLIVPDQVSRVATFLRSNPS